MSAKSERIAEIKLSIEGQKNLVKVAESDGRDPARVQREIDRLEERIARDQREVAILRHRKESWREVISDAEERLAELRVELVETENAEKIEKLRELVGELADVMTPEQIQAMLSQSSEIGGAA